MANPFLYSRILTYGNTPKKRPEPKPSWPKETKQSQAVRGRLLGEPYDGS